MNTPLPIPIRLRPAGTTRAAYWLALLALALLLVAASNVNAAYGPLALVVGCLGVGWLGAIVYNWRLAIWGLLAFMPFIGVAEIPTFPSTTAAVLAKDALFIAPCYGVVLLQSLAQQQHRVSQLPVVPMILLGLLAVLNLANPHQVSLTVGLIGLKVWLLYLPLAFIAQRLIDSRERLLVFLRLIAYGSAISGTIGILEVLLLHGGKQATVYRFYGKAATAMFFGSDRTNGVSFSLGGGAFLSRIPSTMPAPAQFLLLLLGGMACSYALLFLEKRQRPLAAARAVLVVDTIAALSGGERGAFIYVPLLLLPIALSSGRLRSIIVSLPLIVGSLGATVLLFGGAGYGLYTLISGLVVGYSGQTWQQPLQYLGQTFFGLGPGMDTQQAWRYGDQSGSLAWVENWFAKVVIELGWPGLALIVLIWGTILWRAWNDRVTRSSADMRAVQMCFFWYLINMLLQSTKGSPFDIDPANIECWMFAGVMLHLHRFARSTELQHSLPIASR